MNILFVSAVLPYPLYSGGQVRIYNLLRVLSKKHKITLCSFIRNDDEQAYGKELSFLSDIHVVHRGKALQPKYLFRTVFTSYPWLLATYENNEMKRVIKEELRKKPYDCIHIEPFYVYPSIPKTNVPLVVSEHNIEYDVYGEYARRFWFSPAKPYMFFDVWKMKRWEEETWKKAASVVAVSEEDKEVIARVTGEERVTVAPNGVSTRHFHFKTPLCDEKNLRFLFTGNFSWLPNREAARILIGGIWPKIQATYKNASLSIVGKHIPNEIKKTRSKNISFREDIKDIRSVLETSDMLLAPMTIGGGSKFKILEAMASGVPVITTKEGAVGLSVRDGVHMEITDVEGFLKRISALVSDRKHYETVSKEGRKLVERAYNWDKISETLSNVWEEAV